MALQVNGIVLDSLTADPTTPVDGEVWYNSTENRFKVRRNGATQALSDLAELTAHTGNISNPHSVNLEQARTAGNVLAGGVDLGGNKITNSGAPTVAGDLTTKTYVDDKVENKLRGWDWQESVLDRNLATPPGSPVTGDRYLVAAGGTGTWSGKDGQIAEWDGSAWVFSPPDEGFATRVEDEDVMIIYDGTSWGPFGSAIDHGNLTGLGDDDHTIYILASGARAMAGNLDMGVNNITNVGTVDGVDVSAHASRHINGGLDVIDGDKLDVTWTGHTNYTPSTSPIEVDAVGQLTAHLAGIDTALAGAGGFLEQKAGSVAAVSFSGKTATVTFASSFADANYAVVLTAVTTGNAHYNCVVQSQTAGSFVIHKGSNSTSGLTQVNWIAMKNGES